MPQQQPSLRFRPKRIMTPCLLSSMHAPDAFLRNALLTATSTKKLQARHKLFSQYGQSYTAVAQMSFVFCKDDRSQEVVTLRQIYNPDAEMTVLSFASFESIRFYSCSSTRWRWCSVISALIVFLKYKFALARMVRMYAYIAY